MNYEQDNEFHANRMAHLNEQREYDRLEHEEALRLMRDDRRERFAMAAMQGILAHHECTGVPESVALAARQMADALIAELDKEGKA